MSNFQCLMGDCPNTCCKGWRVQVKKPEYKALKKVYSKSKKTREIFRTFINRNKDPQANDDLYAEIAMSKETKHCSFLKSDGACQVHSDYGVKYLPSVCETFPRNFSLFKDRTELYGDFACPEVTRLCLLDQQAFDMQALPKEKLPQRKIYAQYIWNESDGYNLYYNDIKHFILDFLKHDEISIEERCFYINCLATSLSEHYYKGCNKDILTFLQTTITQFQSEPSLRQAKSIYDSCPKGNSEALLTLISVARTAQQLGANHSTGCFEEVMENCFRAISQHVPELEKYLSYNTEIPPECYQNLIRFYSGQLSESTSINNRISLYLKNYSLNYWAKQSFTNQDNLTIYTSHWIITIAIIKVLLFTHPKWNDILLLSKTDESQAIALMDDLIVDIVYRFSRGFEHKELFMKMLSEYIGLDNQNNLTKAAIFLKI